MQKDIRTTSIRIFDKMYNVEYSDYRQLQVLSNLINCINAIETKHRQYKQFAVVSPLQHIKRRLKTQVNNELHRLRSIQSKLDFVNNQDFKRALAGFIKLKTL